MRYLKSDIKEVDSQVPHSTLAWMTISVFSMSFLLWIILSSNWARLCFSPSPEWILHIFLTVCCRTWGMADGVFLQATLRLLGTTGLSW